MSNKNIISTPFYLSALITANGGIILSLFYLTLHCIDNVNYAMGFLKSEVTLSMILILSVFSALTSAFVLIILYRKNNKSYFFRKVAFISFWLCVFYALTHLKIVLPITIEKDLFKPVWFAISLFTIITSVYCIGLLVMMPSKKNVSAPQTPAHINTAQPMNMSNPNNNAQHMNVAQQTNQQQHTNSIHHPNFNEFNSFQSIEISIPDNASSNNDIKPQ